MLSDFKVQSIEHATSLPDSDAARALLEKVRRGAEALLRERRWKVLSLVELCCCKEAPEKKANSVAGWCMPAGDSVTATRIALRLRHPKGKGHGLLDFEEVFGTMLHELSHIVHLKHTPAFYQLMDELRAQYEQLEASGRVLDEAGFPTIGGHRTTGTFHNPSAAEGRSRALDAAVARANASRLMGSGKLGHGPNASSWAQLSPRERAARAAERRAAEAALGLGDDELPEAPAAKTAEESRVPSPPGRRPPASVQPMKRRFCSQRQCTCGLIHDSFGDNSAARPGKVAPAERPMQPSEDRLLQLAIAASLSEPQMPTDEETLQAVLAASAEEASKIASGSFIVLSDDETEMAS
mmetsp:Transcript_16534/g.28908  ORF Transcript_16534/g.28908 Transcript_16534/m.28908 type:complete len:353 (-) Transcript_16534:51-1109(-)